MYIIKALQRIAVLTMVALILLGLGTVNAEEEPALSLIIGYLWRREEIGVSEDLKLSGIIPITAQFGLSNIKNIKEVNFFVDDKLIISDDTYPYEFEWNTFKVRGGRHKIKAVALTKDNNTFIEEKYVNVDYYMSDLCVVAPDKAGASLVKWIGVNDREGIYDARISINGARLISEYEKFERSHSYSWIKISFPSQLLSSASNYYPEGHGWFFVQSGDKATFDISYPGVSIYESIIVPYTAKNLSSSDIERWINGEDEELVLNWEAPEEMNFNSWHLEIEMYDTDKRMITYITGENLPYVVRSAIIKSPDVINEAIGSMLIVYRDKIPPINIDTFSTKIPRTVLKEETRYVKIYVVSNAKRDLGFNYVKSTSPVGFFRTSYSIYGVARSEPLTNMPQNY